MDHIVIFKSYDLVHLNFMDWLDTLNYLKTYLYVH